jgi:Flp pilus assembly protein TadD
MRAICLVALSVLSAPALAQPLTVIVPPGSDDEGLLIQERAAHILRATGKYDELHVKQIVRMAEHEGIELARVDAAQAQLIAKRLGARRAVFSKLAGNALEISGTGFTKAPAIKKTLSAELPRRVDEAGRALAEAVLKADGVAMPEVPALPAAAPLASYGTCYAILIKQPIGVETPTVLSVAELGRALKACRAATEADANFAAAWAALALAQAFGGDDADSVKSLLRIKDTARDLPLYWLARYWMVTRHVSPEAGGEILAQAVKRYPGFLLARGYLAEHQGVLKKHDDALSTWDEYLVHVPDSSFIRGRMSSSLAKLGRHADAVAKAKEAVAKDPDAREAQLELGSRHLDAGKYAEAIAIFKPLAAAPHARGELLLRLGYAQMLSGDLPGAEATLDRALRAADQPSEWRTRGRALADLARVYLKKGQNALAEEKVREARQANLTAVLLSQNDPALKKLVDGNKKPISLALDPKFVKPKELSPFAVDDAGLVDPKTRAFGNPPASIQLLRF